MSSNYLAKLREENNLSAKDLADVLGVEESLVLSWENGEKELETKQLEKIASFFEVTEQDVLFGPDYIEEQNKKKDEKFQHLLDSASPIVKPEGLNHLLGSVIDDLNRTTSSIKSNWSSENASYEPAYSFEELKNMIEKDELSQVNELIPFMDSKLKSIYLQRLMRDEEFEALELCYPYLNRMQKEKVIQYYIKMEYTQDFDLLLLLSDRYSKGMIQKYLIESKHYSKEELIYLFPLFDEDGKNKMLEVLKEDSVSVDDMARVNAFLSEEQKEKLVEKLINNGFVDYVSVFEDLPESAKKMVLDQRVEADLNCKDYVPHCSDTIKEELILESLKKNGRFLSDYCPFLNNEQMKLILDSYICEPFDHIEEIYPYFGNEELTSLGQFFMDKNDTHQLTLLNEYLTMNRY